MVLRYKHITVQALTLTAKSMIDSVVALSLANLKDGIKIQLETLALQQQLSSDPLYVWHHAQLGN